MKPSLLLAALFVLLGFFASPAPAQTQSPVTFDTFFQELSPYGEWIDVQDYGMSWRPKVDPGWRPYTDGRWAQTDAGWTWMSNEPWGWIVYHYGRWTTLDDGGWVWVPGYEWAPAWVSWRANDDYVGWAPLPPEAVWQPSTGFSTTVDVSYSIGPQYYNFCPVQNLGWPSLRPVLLPTGQNITLIGGTTNVTIVTVQNNAIYCAGPDYAQLNSRAKYPIPQYQLQRCQSTDGWPASSDRQNLLKQGVLPVLAPKVYPIFSATTQRSVTSHVSRPRSNPGQRVDAQPTPPGQPAVIQPPRRVVGYPVSGVPAATPSPIQAVSPAPAQLSGDSRPGDPRYRQQQAQQAQVEENDQRRRNLQQQTPPPDTAVRIQQQQQEMQERNRRIQEAQQEQMRQRQQSQIDQQQRQAEVLQKQREAMQQQLQQQQDRQRQQQQQYQQQQQPPPASSQYQPRSQQTPPPGSGWKTLNNY